MLFRIALIHLVVQLCNAYLQLGRFSFGNKFHSARNFIRHEISFGTKFHSARNFIRHGTQKPKFDNRKRAPYLGILTTVKTRENANFNVADSESFRQDRRRAILLLQEATKLIGEEYESSNTSRARVLKSETNQNAISPGQQNRENTQRPQRQNQSSSSTTSTRTLGNFRDLFRPYGSNNRGSLSSTNQEAKLPKKRKKHNHP